MALIEVASGQTIRMLVLGGGGWGVVRVMWLCVATESQSKQRIS